MWNLSQKQLPDEWGAKEAATKVFNYFIDYFAGIKGEQVPLTFEITDGTYHAVDSKYIGYLYATVYALIDCFDKDYRKFKENSVDRTIRNNGD